MTKQITAVEWLEDKVTDMIHESNHIELVSLLEQAKKMEKEQLNIARIDGINLANKGYGSKNTSNLPNVNPDDVIPSSPQFVRQTLI